MDVEELKRHIHQELFGECFSDMAVNRDWKEQRKEAVMLCSVRTMQRFHQSIADIERMLEEKFLLTESEAADFLKNAHVIPRK